MSVKKSQSPLGELKGGLGGVVPPDPGLAVLLFQFQSPELVLPALLAVPQLLALVHAQAAAPRHLQVFVAPHRVPETRHGTGPGRTQGGGVVAVVLQVAGREQAVAGHHVEAVPGQNQAVGVLVAGAAVETCVARLQALNQQPSLEEEDPILIALELRDETRV